MQSYKRVIVPGCAVNNAFIEGCFCLDSG